jgi:hypothetical protein
VKKLLVLGIVVAIVWVGIRSLTRSLERTRTEVYQRQKRHLDSLQTFRISPNQRSYDPITLPRVAPGAIQAPTTGVHWDVVVDTADPGFFDSLQRVVAAVNEGYPRRLDEETTMLRIEVTPGGIVNRYRLTSLTWGEISQAGLMEQLRPRLRQQTCSIRLYRIVMEKGSRVTYSYVDRNDYPAGDVTFTRADCR